MTAASAGPIRRRLSAMILVVLLLLLAGAVAREIWDYSEARRFEAHLAALRAKGDPITTFDLVRAKAGAGDVYRDEGNEAARYYSAAAALVQRRAWTPGSYPTVNACRPDVGAATDRGSSEAQLASMRAHVDANADAIQLLRRASALPFRHFSAGTEYSYRTSQLHSLAELSSAWTCVLAMGGDADGAVDAVLATVRLLRVADAASSWLPWLRQPEADVITVLERTHPSDAALARLQEGLADPADEGAVEALFVRQRAQLLVNSHRYFGTGAGIAPRPAGAFRLLMDDYLLGPWNRRGMNGLVRTFTALVDAARQPWPAKLSAIEAVGGTQLVAGWSIAPRIDAGLLVAEYKGRARAVARSVVAMRAAVAAVAAVRYHEASGAWPDTLAVLEPAYLPRPVTDLLTGKALQYARASDGFVIYGIGADGQDNGGRVDMEPPPNRSQRPFESIARDWGVRVRVPVDK